MTSDPRAVAVALASRITTPVEPLAAALGRAHASSVGRYARDLTAEQLADVEAEAGELLRLERKRTAVLGVVFPWETFRHRTLFSANVEIEDRFRENGGDAAAILPPATIQQEPTLAGGALGMSFGNAQAGLRSISAQDGLRVSASLDYLKAPSDDRWRSGLARSCR